MPPAMASPEPESRIISPLSTPAGIATEISCSLRTTPLPLHALHFSFGIFPVPRQLSHTRTLVNVPRIEFFVSCIFPLPLHTVHVTCSVPGFPPVPRHASHVDVFVSKTFRVVPNIESRNEISISIEMSLPRCVRRCV